jgi:crossover junction endodeoxyribonuclease RuvC
MKILAIDPGYERVGIAVLEKIPGIQKEILLYSDCFKTDKALSLNERIFLIGKEVERIIDLYKPTICSIEKLFFTSNQKTAMGVAEARGVCIYSAMRNNLIVLEYTPLEIKQAVAGYGKADKTQVHDMVRQLIQLPPKKYIDDEIDAIAIGLTGFAVYRP